MSGMTDPTNALISFQSAIINEAIKLTPAERHPGVFVHVDTPDGENPRYTYAEIEHDVVNAVALLILHEPIEGIPCFQLGYAVREDSRGEGKATAIVNAAINEVTVGLGRSAKGQKLYIEAVVGRENAISRKVAEKALGTDTTECEDSVSGEPAIQYLKLFQL